jgi:tetratricopeptide (TPR) repeat protein
VVPRKTIWSAALVSLAFSCGCLAQQKPTGTSPQSDKLDSYEQVLKQKPKDEMARHGEVAEAIEEALAARRNGNNELALAFLLRANRWVHDDAELLTDIGIQEEAMNLHQDADTVLTQAQQLLPADPKLLYAIARNKMELSQVQASEQAWKQYLALRPNDASAHYGYGLLLQMMQRTEEARAEFEKSIALSPNQAESYYRLGEITRNAGQVTQAEQFYKQALGHDAAHAGAWAGLGILAYNARHYDEAEHDLAKSVQLSQNLQIAHYYHGLALGKLGLKEESTKELQTAVRLADAENARRQEAKHLAAQPYQPQ